MLLNGWQKWRQRQARNSTRVPAAELEIEVLESRVLPAGTWTDLTNLAPALTGTMLLLTDGTVLVQGHSPPHLVQVDAQRLGQLH